MSDPMTDRTILDTILGAAVDAMVVTDQTGTILRSNAATTKLFQREPEELIGQNVSILMPKDMADHHGEYMADYITSGQARIIGTGRELEGQRKDGTIFALHISVGDAEVEGQRMFVAIMHDLTARKATQDALARSQRLDAIGQMTGGIAHDFNNLLTIIIGNLELLEMRGADDRQLPLIQDALATAELGADLTSRLMIFARKGDLKPVTSDLRDVCSKTIAMLNRTLDAGHTIRTDFAPHVSPVLIDPVQLQSALMNLTLNAKDAMGAKGELLVSVANVRIDDTYMAQETDIEQGDYVRVFVSDNGAGMSVDAQKRAFEPFFTTKANSGGTGLGLAMVYGFVKQSGGHITIYSEPGLGTSFGLYFPALKDAHDERRTPPDDPATAYMGQGQTVLVVEDNPKVRQLSVARIIDLGYKTLEAASGEIAYQMLKDGVDADIVFTDLVMPGALNGYDLAAKIEAEFPHLKVLITSGYASDVVTDTLAHDTSFAILHKPYRQSELAKRLHTLLTGSMEA